MLHGLIFKATKFQLPTPKRLKTVVKNILGGGIMPLPQCQIGLIRFMYSESISKNFVWHVLKN